MTNAISTDSPFCIYAIRNRLETRYYIGATSRGATRRLDEHWQLLAGGRHKNAGLQADFNRLQGEGFDGVTLEHFATASWLSSAENRWISDLRKEGATLYNDAGTRPYAQSVKASKRFLQFGELTVRLDADTAATLQHQAEQIHVTVEELAARCIQSSLSGHNESYDTWIKAIAQSMAAHKATTPPK